MASETAPAPRTLDVVDRRDDRAWVDHAVGLLVADDAACVETPMRTLDLASAPEVDVYLKDESQHPTGSLKHRLARSLVLYGLCNGWIREGTTLVEASSGSTAVSEAWFAQLLGLPFVAVLPRSTSREKVDLIEELGGEIHFVEAPELVYAEAQRIAEARGGHYLDQFTYAERATDWRGNNNIAESLLDGLVDERHPVPHWIVVGAGTGGTATTVGRFLRYRHVPTKLCVVDPEGSAYFDALAADDPSIRTAGSAIEGIGRPRLEPSFTPTLVDRALRIPDAASVAAMRWLHERTGLSAGPSTGTNLVGVLSLAREVAALGGGSIVTLLCDCGDRYDATYNDDAWIASKGWDLTPWRAWLDTF